MFQIVNYYDFKEANPNFFENVDLGHLSRIGEDQVIIVPPYREGSGRRMLQYRMGNWDPEKYCVDELFQATLAILEIAILEPQAQILGGICIFDFKDLSMQQAWYMTPNIARKMIQVMVVSVIYRLLMVHHLILLKRTKLYYKNQ